MNSTVGGKTKIVGMNLTDIMATVEEATNFTVDDTGANNASKLICIKPTPDQMAFYNVFSWWLEGEMRTR